MTKKPKVAPNTKQRTPAEVQVMLAELDKLTVEDLDEYLEEIQMQWGMAYFYRQRLARRLGNTTPPPVPPWADTSQIEVNRALAQASGKPQ